MPAKNTVKQFEPHSYYHVYNRGVAKQKIFLDQADKRYFLHLLDRYLNPANKDSIEQAVSYKKYNQQLELQSYCLMGNHYHLLFYLKDDMTALIGIMRSIGTAYTMYFNLKYKRVGPIFQGTYKASRVTNDSYLQHISRYIHRNPREYMTYKHSSLLVYLQKKQPEPWLKPQRSLELFEGDSYVEFLEDYDDFKDMNRVIRHDLANK